MERTLDIGCGPLHDGEMTSDLDAAVDAKLSRGDREKNRRYLRNFVPAMVLYALAVVIGASVGHDTLTKRLIFLLVPVVPLLLVVRAVVGWIRSADEYQRLATYRVLAISFVVAMVVAVLMGFAGSAFSELDPSLGGWVVFAAGMATWAAHGLRDARR